MIYKNVNLKSHQYFLLVYVSIITFILMILKGGIFQYGPFIMEISVFIFVILWFVWYSKKQLNFNISKYNIFLLLFVIWSFISSWLSDSQFNAFVRWMEYLSFIIMIFMTRQVFTDNSIILIFQAIIIFFGFFQAVIGIVQFFGFGFARAVGTFGKYANFYSHFLGISFLTILWVMFKSKLKKSKNEKLLLFLLFLVIGLGLVLSFSRVIVFIAIPIIFFSTEWRKRIPILIISVISVLILFFFFKNFGGRNVLGGDPFHLSRIFIWKQSIILIFKKMLFGYGPASFPTVAPLSNFPTNSMIIKYGKCAQYAHNNYLDIAVETGIPGLIFFIGILAGSLKNLFTKKKVKLTTYFFSVLTLWIAVVGFFDTVFYPPMMEFFGALIIGITNPYKEVKFSGNISYRIKRIILICLLIVILIIISTTIGFILLDIAKKNIQSGEISRIQKTERILDIAYYLMPINEDVDYMRSFIYEYYYNVSKNTMWLELAYKAALRSVKDDINYIKYKRIFILEEKLGYYSKAKETALIIISLQPYYVFNYLNYIKYETDFNKIKLSLKFAKNLEPNSIALLSELYKFGEIKDSVIYSWNFDSLFLLCRSKEDTFFVGNYYSVNKISNILLIKGKTEQANNMWLKIVPAFKEDTNFIYIYAQFLKTNNLDLDKYISNLDPDIPGSVIDSLKKLDR